MTHHVRAHTSLSSLSLSLFFTAEKMLVKCLFFVLNTPSLPERHTIYDTVYSCCANENLVGLQPYEKTMVAFTEIPGHPYSYIVLPGIQTNRRCVLELRQTISKKSDIVMIDDSMELTDLWQGTCRQIVRPSNKEGVIQLESLKRDIERQEQEQQQEPELELEQEQQKQQQHQKEKEKEEDKDKDEEEEMLEPVNRKRSKSQLSTAQKRPKVLLEREGERQRQYKHPSYSKRPNHLAQFLWHFRVSCTCGKKKGKHEMECETKKYTITHTNFTGGCYSIGPAYYEEFIEHYNRDVWTKPLGERHVRSTWRYDALTEVAIPGQTCRLFLDVDGSTSQPPSPEKQIEFAELILHGVQEILKEMLETPGAEEDVIILASQK